jgi:hypothetical protein
MYQQDDTSNEPDPCQKSANKNTDALPNEIPNDCDMTTELVPKEIENDFRLYWIVYRMASQETVETPTKR